MPKRTTPRPSNAEIEEAFLLQTLRRLENPQQRYIFTLIVDLISAGMAASQAAKPKRTANV
jgi:hypothetical protein